MGCPGGFGEGGIGWEVGARLREEGDWGKVGMLGGGCIAQVDLEGMEDLGSGGLARDEEWKGGQAAGAL